MYRGARVTATEPKAPCRGREPRAREAEHPPDQLTAGERWARDELARLLVDRFSPRASASFLAASFRRSAQVRGQRPALARQARLWLSAGALPWLVMVVAGRPADRGRAGAGLAWWTAVALMLDWHLGMVETADGRLRPLSGADALTLTRAWLVPVAAWSPTPPVCGLAAASDALDGALARRGHPTRAGRDLEGLVDACFTAAALRGLVRSGRLGRAAAGLEGARVGAGALYATWIYFARARPPDPYVAGAGRVTSAIRVGALLAAGSGRRRIADAALACGSLASMALLARAAARSAALRAPNPTPASAPDDPGATRAAHASPARGSACERRTAR